MRKINIHFDSFVPYKFFSIITYSCTGISSWYFR